MLSDKNASRAALVIIALALLIGSGSGAPMNVSAAKGAAVVPAHFEVSDPSGSFVLPPDYYEWVAIQLETGMNATFKVCSNATVDVYFMNSYQFKNFQSNGSTQSIYNFEGRSAKANIGPFYGGAYYLIIHDASSQSANVSYDLSTLPVNIYSRHRSLPAPVGIADYGVLNASGALLPYKILYDEAVGLAHINSMQAYNSSPPAGISKYGASLQQNVVLQVNTTDGNYEYWLQNVPSFWTNKGVMYFVDNVWNCSAPVSHLSNQTITGSGYVSYYGSDAFYGHATPLQSYSLPLTLYLITDCSYSYSAVHVSFGYAFSSTSSIIWYDNVTIRESDVKSASLVVSGYSLTPRGTFYDSELVFGGEGSGEQTNFTQMNATLLMWYLLQNGSKIYPPAVYGFGSDTAEAADDLSTALVNGRPAVEIGSGNFEPVQYSAQIPAFTAEIRLSASPVDSGMEVPVKVSSAIANGISPYTYLFYIGNSLVYNFTAYSSQISETVLLPPLEAGTYQLRVAVFDSVNHSAYSSACVIKVNPDPIAFIASNASTTDEGLPLNLSVFAARGTPPYSYSLYINDKIVKAGSSERPGLIAGMIFVPNQSGTLAAKIILTDSAGYTVSYSLSIQVNQDPELSISCSRNITDVNVPVSVSSEASFGTPPYTYSWYLNGQKVNSNASTYVFDPASPGNYRIDEAVIDSAGYKVEKSIIIKVNQDPSVLSLTQALSSSSIFLTNNVAQLKANAQGGTPPYNYSWYLNGKLVATTSSPEYSYSLNLGQNSLQVKISDSLGYSVISQPVAVTASYNYSAIAGLIAAMTIAAIAIAVVAKRKR